MSLLQQTRKKAWVKYLAIFALLSIHAGTVEMSLATTSIEKPGPSSGQFHRNNGQYSNNQRREKAVNGRGRSPEGNRIDRRHQQHQNSNSKREHKQKASKQDDTSFVDMMRNNDVSSFPTWGDFSERYDEETEIESELYNNLPPVEQQAAINYAKPHNQSSFVVSTGQSKQTITQSKTIKTPNKRNGFLQQWQRQSKGNHFLLIQTALMISFGVAIVLASVLPSTAKITLSSVQDKFHAKLAKLAVLTLTNLLPTFFLLTQATKHYPFLVWSGFVNTLIWGIPMWLVSEFFFSTIAQTTIINYLQPEIFLLKSAFPSVLVPWLRKSRLLLTPQTRQLCRVAVEVLVAPLAELFFIQRSLSSAMRKVEFEEEKQQKRSSLLTAYFFTALITAAAIKTLRAWFTLCLSKGEGLLSLQTLLLSSFNSTTDLCAVMMAVAMWKAKTGRKQQHTSSTETEVKTSKKPGRWASSGIKSFLIAFFLRAVAAVCGMKPLHHWLTLINSNSSYLSSHSSTLLLVIEFSKVIWTAMILAACLHVVSEISSSLPQSQPSQPPANQL